MRDDEVLLTAGPASDRREQILDEVLRLAGQRGYRGLSYQDVAKRCGLSKQGVMHYFPSKKLLMLSLLNERDASIESDLLKLLTEGGFERAGDALEKQAIFRESLVKVIEYMLQTPDLIRLHVILKAESIDPDHPARDFFVERDRATLAWLAERSTPFSATPHSTARQILAMMSGLQEQWLREGCGFDLLAEWADALSVLFSIGDARP